MSRKEMRISIKSGDKILPLFAASSKDGVIMGVSGGPKHLTVFQDHRTDLRMHTTDQETNEREPIPFIESLKGFVEQRVPYQNIEDFRFEYQHAFITYWCEDRLEPTKTILPEDPNHIILDFDVVAEGLKELYISVSKSQVMTFNFEEVPIGDTLFILELQSEGARAYYLQRQSEEYWELMDISVLNNAFQGMGMAFKFKED